MKYKHLAVIFAATVSLSSMTVAQAEETATTSATTETPAPAATPVEAATPVTTPAPEAKPVQAHNAATVEAVNTAAAADEGKELDMFRFSLRMEKVEFVKKAMKLEAEQEKKFMDLYYPYDVELKKLSDKRLALIAAYADKFDNMTDADADKLAKESLAFRKQRNALLEKYYGKIAKATSKTTAARFLQIENILQATTDVKIGSTLPLLPPQ